MAHLPHRAVSALTTVVVPVKDEDPTVLQRLREDVTAHGYPLILVDDGSAVPVSQATIRFPVSRGYGAALKAGIDRATTDFVVTMDGDGQHSAWDVKRLEDFLVYFPPLDMVVGDRRVRESSPLRFWGRKGLNWVASCFAGRWIPDLNSGLRIFRRSVAVGYAPILCNQFSFTTSLTLAMLADGYHVDWLPIKVEPRRHGKTKVHLWYDGWVTLKYILWIGIACRTRRLRGWLRDLDR